MASIHVHYYVSKSSLYVSTLPLQLLLFYLSEDLQSLSGILTVTNSRDGRGESFLLRQTTQSEDHSMKMCGV